MRLQHYLTEGYKSISVDDIDALIQKDCKPYLRQIKDKHLYRGMKSDYDALKAVPRTERMPTDTPIAMHKLFDNIAQELFGWKPRAQGVFVTAGREQAQAYGIVYEIFPVGNFKFLYSPKVHDFFPELQGKIEYFRYSHSAEKTPASKIMKTPAFKNIISTFIKKSYTDKDLYKAIKYECEVMILCKSYYGKQKLFEM